MLLGGKPPYARRSTFNSTPTERLQHRQNPFPPVYSLVVSKLRAHPFRYTGCVRRRVDVNEIFVIFNLKCRRHFKISLCLSLGTSGQVQLVCFIAWPFLVSLLRVRLLARSVICICCRRMPCGDSCKTDSYMPRCPRVIERKHCWLLRSGFCSVQVFAAENIIFCNMGVGRYGTGSFLHLLNF